MAGRERWGVGIIQFEQPSSQGINISISESKVNIRAIASAYHLQGTSTHGSDMRHWSIAILAIWKSRTQVSSTRTQVSFTHHFH